MSGDKFVLDTNAVLYILAGDETITDFLFEKQLYISVITELELLSYRHISIKEQKQVSSFLTDLIIIDINSEIKELTIAIKKNSNLKLPDSIIAATAMYLKLPFVTSDKQFKTLENFDLVFYDR